MALGEMQRKVLGMLHDAQEPMSIPDLRHCLGIARSLHPEIKRACEGLVHAGYIRRSEPRGTAHWVITDAGCVKIKVVRLHSNSGL